MINYTAERQMSMFDLDIWSGKTYKEHSAVTEAKTSAPYLKKQRESQGKTFLYLRLPEENGNMPAPVTIEAVKALIQRHLQKEAEKGPEEVDE